jgi:nucleotide-binding universal stress UspA family protein
MFENVVVGATNSATSTRAVRRAIEVARASGGTLHIVTAFRSKRARRTDGSDDRRDGGSPADSVELLLAEFRLMALSESVPVETHPVSSDPAEAITRVATEENADLIVVGSKSARGARQLSDVPKAVMDRADCAILVV